MTINQHLNIYILRFAAYKNYNGVEHSVFNLPRIFFFLQNFCHDFDLKNNCKNTTQSVEVRYCERIKQFRTKYTNQKQQSKRKNNNFMLQLCLKQKIAFALKCFDIFIKVQVNFHFFSYRYLHTQFYTKTFIHGTAKHTAHIYWWCEVTSVRRRNQNKEKCRKLGLAISQYTVCKLLTRQAYQHRQQCLIKLETKYFTIFLMPTSAFICIMKYLQQLQNY